jgi:hypothetical protein
MAIYIIIDSREIGGRTLYRFRCSEAAGEPEQTFLHEVLPSFVTNIIIKVSSFVINMNEFIVTFFFL